jgi:hypothetical protein
MARSLVGSWAFLIGVILAIILGVLGPVSDLIPLLLVVLGLLVGFLNITDKEVQPFLMAGTVLVIVTALGGPVLDTLPVMQRILQAMLILFVPATIIVALTSVFRMAKH